MGRFKQEKCGLRGILATTQIMFFNQKKPGKLTQNSGISTNIWHWPSESLGTEDVTKNRWSGQKAACFPMVFPHRCLQQGISSVAWIKYVQVIWGWVKTYYCHMSGNNHPFTNYFRVPRVPGFWLITISNYIWSVRLVAQKSLVRLTVMWKLES